MALENALSRVAVLLYGGAAYAISLSTLMYFMGFLANLPFLPKTIDSTDVRTSDRIMTEAVIANTLLLLIFSVSHSIMARLAFKRVWTQLIPECIERSTFILVASAALLLTFWQWRPLTQPVWTVEHPTGVLALSAIYWLGWATCIGSTFLINHFELYGLQQVFSYFCNSEAPESAFKTPFLYRLVRHPSCLGMLLALWATPAMSAGHLLFASIATTYTLIGIQFEENDLITMFGERYLSYREQVGMLLPRSLGCPYRCEVTPGLHRQAKHLQKNAADEDVKFTENRREKSA